MEIDFRNLIVNRIIIHTINSKTREQEHSSVEYSSEIINIDSDVLDMIKLRLIDAVGKESRAFELEIEDRYQNSFFDVSTKLHNLSDIDFISESENIAYLLAQSQKRPNIPESFLMIIDCQNDDNRKPIVIVIKAEPHKALQFSSSTSQLELLNKVFLSPSQKLYKIGLIEFLDNNEFGGFLFDDQFRVSSSPAEYFYKDFLGFSVSENSKIQSQKFYSQTASFVENNIEDLDIKKGILSALKNLFTVDTNDIIQPYDFANRYIPTENGLRGAYLSDISDQLPISIVRNTALIESKLNKRKIHFSSNINLSGPEESFDSKVEIINNPEDLSNLDLSDRTFTFVKISGRPYSSND